MPETVADAAVPPATRELLQLAIDNQPFTRWTRAELVDVEPGFVSLRMDMRENEMTQHHGFLHGGLIAFLADNVAAYAAATLVGDVLSAQFNLNFLSPGVGTGFRAEGRVVKAGKRQAVVAVEVRSEGPEEKLIAVAQAVVLPAGDASVRL